MHIPIDRYHLPKPKLFETLPPSHFIPPCHPPLLTISRCVRAAAAYPLLQASITISASSSHPHPSMPKISDTRIVSRDHRSLSAGRLIPVPLCGLRIHGTCSQPSLSDT